MSTQQYTTVSGALAGAASQLTLAGVVNPRVDAELLIGHVLDLNRGQVQSKAITDAPLAPEDAGPSQSSSRVGPRGSRCSTSPAAPPSAR